MQQQSVSSEARQRVIQAAYSLFVERGFADVSMQQIADSASITKATLYHHFKDKQDLYLASMRMAFTRDTSSFMQGIEEAPEIKDVVRSILNFVVNKNRGDMQRLMSDFHQHVDKPSQEAFWAEFPRPWRALEPTIQRCIDAGQVRETDASFVSQFVYSAIIGYAHILRNTSDIGENPDQFYERFTESIMHGISR